MKYKPYQPYFDHLILSKPDSWTFKQYLQDLYSIAILYHQ